MKKEHNKVLSIIAIATLIITVIGASFAYFGASVNTGTGSALTTVVEDNDVLFTATGADMSLEITADKMMQSASSEGSIVAGNSSNSSLTVSLEVGTENPIACTYNIYYKWDSATSAYLTKTTGATKEFTTQLILNDMNQNGSGGINYIKEETQFTNIVTTTNKTLVVKGASIVADAENAGNQIWTPIIKFYNLAGKDQSALANKSFKGKFTIDDVECGGIKNLSDSVIAQISDADYISSQDESIYKVAREMVGNTDAGVRYEGKDPNNYVTFNGESWRIIGTFNGGEVALDDGKKYTKIIKETSIGSHAWNNCEYWNDMEGDLCDEEGENDWVNSTLNEYLNDSYLLSLNESNKIAKYNGQYSAWYLKGLDYETLMSESGYAGDWFIGERVNGKPGYRDEEKYAADSSTREAIGLMYPSDYGYAAYGSECNNTTTILFGYNGAGCDNVDWLSGSYDWFISPMPDEPSAAYILDEGSVNYSGWLSYEYAVRPTLYLETNVGYASGNGSKENPYVLVSPEAIPKSKLSDEVLAKVSDNEYTSSQPGGGVYKVAQENVTYNSQTLNAGVRYEGKDPDNYVIFNDEGWRIIGVFEGSTIGLEEGKQYTKIITQVSLGEYSWDGSLEWDEEGIEEVWNGDSAWKLSSLNKYLNGEYLNTMKDSYKIARHNGEYSTWYLRGLTEEESYKAYVYTWYLGERYTGYAGYQAGIQYAADLESKAAIGLMYPSDLGYAAYGLGCNRDSLDVSSYDMGCSTVDWLSLDYSWLISPCPSTLGKQYVVRDGGHVAADEIVFLGNRQEVYPTLYLEANVAFASGDGSIANPYILN